MSFHITSQEQNTFGAGFEQYLEDMALGMNEIDICNKMGLSFRKLQFWIRQNEVRLKLYSNAMELHKEFFILRIIKELTAIGLVDIAGAFNPNGTLKAIDDIPVEIRRVISGLEVKETFIDTPDGKKWDGYLKTVKMNDKIKSLELLGKKLNMFATTLKVEHSGVVTHSVEKFDLDERLALLRMPRTTPTVQHETLDVVVEEAHVALKPGKDI